MQSDAVLTTHVPGPGETGIDEFGTGGFGIGGFGPDKFKDFRPESMLCNVGIVHKQTVLVYDG